MNQCKALKVLKLLPVKEEADVPKHYMKSVLFNRDAWGNRRANLLAKVDFYFCVATIIDEPPQFVLPYYDGIAEAVAKECEEANKNNQLVFAYNKGHSCHVTLAWGNNRLTFTDFEGKMTEVDASSDLKISIRGQGRDEFWAEDEEGDEHFLGRGPCPMHSEQLAEVEYYQKRKFLWSFVLNPEMHVPAHKPCSTQLPVAVDTKKDLLLLLDRPEF